MDVCFCLGRRFVRLLAYATGVKSFAPVRFGSIGMAAFVTKLRGCLPQEKGIPQAAFISTDSEVISGSLWSPVIVELTFVVTGFSNLVPRKVAAI
jgi:hypothetical protein